MSEFILKKEQTLPLGIEEVFAFFADAGNLERITPPELNFRIVTPQPFEIFEGRLIDYALKLYGFPIKWQTEISTWEPPHRFVDQQLHGPYSQWIHTHVFTALGKEETLVEDEVRYRLPLEPIGDIAHFIVRKQLDRIFDYRELKVDELLTKKS